MKRNPGYRAVWNDGTLTECRESEHYSVKAALRAVAAMADVVRSGKGYIETLDSNPRKIWRGEFLEG